MLSYSFHVSFPLAALCCSSGVTSNPEEYFHHAPPFPRYIPSVPLFISLVLSSPLRAGFTPCCPAAAVVAPLVFCPPLFLSSASLVPGGGHEPHSLFPMYHTPTRTTHGAPLFIFFFFFFSAAFVHRAVTVPNATYSAPSVGRRTVRRGFEKLALDTISSSTILL